MLSCLLNGERINCFDGKHDKEQLKKWAKKRILICPACGKPYEYCHGKVKSPYFRHMDKTECEDRYSESETEEHLNGKRDLYEWLKKQHGVTDCILEGWISETKQRPDIMFKYDGKQCVLEYQCSPIATEYCERHELYKAAEIKDIWIAGWEKYFKSNSRHKFIETHIEGYYSPKFKCFLSGDSTKQRQFMNRVYKKSVKSFPLNAYTLNNFNIIHKSYVNKSFEDMYQLHIERNSEKEKSKKINYEINDKRIAYLYDYVNNFKGTFGKYHYYTDITNKNYYLYINNFHSMKPRKFSVDKKNFYQRIYNIKKSVQIYQSLKEILYSDFFQCNKNWSFYASDNVDNITLSVTLLGRFTSYLDCPYNLMDNITIDRLKNLLLHLMKECLNKGLIGDHYIRIMTKNKQEA
jgi:competence CoiA-like predicted nuclease